MFVWECVVMWVISGGINLGGQVLSFISVLLFQRSGYFCFFLTFYCGRVCVLSAFIFQMLSFLYRVVGSSRCCSPGI